MSTEKMKSVLSASTCIYTKEQIEAEIEKMAVAVTSNLKGSNPIVVCVMKGGIVFCSSLILKLDFPLELDYVHATRYADKSVGTTLEWVARPRASLEGRTVLLVDDILDGGITLAEISKECKKLGAKEVYTAVMLDKVDKRVENGLSAADYVAFKMEDKFVFGYGLDYKENLRNAPGIYEPAPEDQF